MKEKKGIITLKQYHCIRCVTHFTIFLIGWSDLYVKLKDPTLSALQEIMIFLLSLAAIIFGMYFLYINGKYEIERDDEMSQKHRLMAHSLIARLFVAGFGIFYLYSLFKPIDFVLPVNRSTLLDIWIVVDFGYNMLASGLFLLYEAAEAVDGE